MRFMHAWLLGAVVIMLAVVPAMGAEFTDRATWQAALASRQDITFDSLNGFILNTGPLGSGSDTVSFIPTTAAWIEIRDSNTPSCETTLYMGTA